MAIPGQSTNLYVPQPVFAVKSPNFMSANYLTLKPLLHQVSKYTDFIIHTYVSFLLIMYSQVSL